MSYQIGQNPGAWQGGGHRSLHQPRLPPPRRHARPRLPRLIIVGVMLDTLRQIESRLVTRHYDGFLRKGHLRSRR